MEKIFDYDKLSKCDNICGFPFVFDENIEKTTELFCLRATCKGDSLHTFICGVDLWTKDSEGKDCWYTTLLHQEFPTLEDLIFAVIEYYKNYHTHDFDSWDWKEIVVDKTTNWETLYLCRDDYFLDEQEEYTQYGDED